MNSINKVKIGGVVYDIVKTNKVLKDEEEDLADGLIDFRSGKIFISNKYDYNLFIYQFSNFFNFITNYNIFLIIN